MRILRPAAWLLTFLVGCGNSTPPTVTHEPTPSATQAVVNPPPTATAKEVAPGTVRSLIPQKIAGPGLTLYPVEGGLAVSEELRVGRVTEKGVEWVGKIPPGGVALGPNRLDRVYGKWPDAIGATFSTSQGRAPEPTYFPITGKGSAVTFAQGGGAGWINGVVRIGESTLVAGWSMADGPQFRLARGPSVFRKFQTPEQAGCKEGEVRKNDYGPPTPAISPSGVESTPAGTLISVGRLCEKRGAAAEIWEKTHTSRIVDLKEWWPKLSYWPSFVKGKDDELFAINNKWSPILHYKDGKFEKVPDLEQLADELFASESGQLHARVKDVIYRVSDNKWEAVWRLPAGFSMGRVAFENGAIWGSYAGDIYKFTEGEPAAAPEQCKTPFVYLYDVSDANAKDFTFPATRKALSTFEGVADLTMLDFMDDNQRRLGLTVKDREQAMKVIAHVNATMPGESPAYLCFAPEHSRKIDILADKPK